MSLLDWFRPAPRQEEPPQSLYELMHNLRVDMSLMQQEWASTQETVLTNLRKMAKRAARDGDCGCGGKGEGRADPVGGENPMIVARRKYGDPWGMR